MKPKQDKEQNRKFANRYGELLLFESVVLNRNENLGYVDFRMVKLLLSSKILFLNALARNA